MIGRIKGILLEKQVPTLLVDVGGVGYEIQASTHTIFRLPSPGVEVILHTHLVVREDSQTLYGFITKDERSLFLALLKVSGIGPKSAITLLSAIEPDEFVRCILDDDVNGLLRLPGIGRKTAERLIIEMRDRFANWQIDSGSVETGFKPVSTMTDTNATGDAISALISLGYAPNEARRVVLKHRKPDITSEDLIRIALKEMGK